MNTRYFNDSFLTKARCYWPIGDFNKYSNTQLISKQFSLTTNKNVQLRWCLRLFTNGINASFKDYVSVHLVLLTGNTPDVEVKYEFSISDGKNGRKNVHRYNNIFEPMKSYGCENFIKRDELLNKDNNLLINNALIIFCDITIFDMGHSEDNVKSKLSHDFKNMFITAKYWDVKFDVSGHQIRAHKSILASRSDVFAAMFEHNMQEAQTNRVVITDISHEVFNEMLHFLYTGEAPNLVELAHDLLAAADKYGLEDLKLMCGEVLCKKLPVEMAADTLILADLHSCQKLKEQTIDFINTYAIEVMETQAWQDMIKTHPHLIAETYRAIVTHQTKFPGNGLMPYVNIANEDEDIYQRLYYNNTISPQHRFDFIDGNL